MVFVCWWHYGYLSFPVLSKFSTSSEDRFSFLCVYEGGWGGGGDVKGFNSGLDGVQEG